MSVEAFRPDQDQVVQFTVSAASQSKRIRSGTPTSEVQLRIVNNGTEPVHIKAGDENVEAADTDLTVLAGVTEVLTLPIPADGALYLAVKGEGATGIFEATGGRGL